MPTRVPIYFRQWRRCFLFDKCVSNKAKSCLNWGDVLLSDKARYGAWQLGNKN